MAEKAKTTDPNKVDWASADEVKKGFATFPFNEIGDHFIGTFVGEDQIANNETGEIAEAFLFEDAEGHTTGIWKSYDLTRKMEEVPEGAAVRIEYVRDIETKRGLNPMKEYSVKFKY